jgi:uncharacterized membrane protein YhaH (DUF805 family)
MMAVTKEACPNCGSPIQVPAGVSRFQCPYCTTSLAVERQNGDIGLFIADRIAGSLETTSSQTRAVIQTGTEVTQTELRRMQIAQDLSMAQMRLSNVQSELRMLERTPPTQVTRRQIQELRAQESMVMQQINTLAGVLNPALAADAMARHAAANARTPRSGGLRWQLFGFRGRIGRGAYWGSLVIMFVLFLIIGSMLPPAAAEGAPPPEMSDPAAFAIFVGIILSTWINLAISVKRFHDRDKAGWWVLISLIPIVGPLWLLIELGFLPGTPGANQYG